MSGQQDYTEEQRAAAWAEYYRQQGIDPAAAQYGSSTTESSYGYGASGSASASGSGSGYGYGYGDSNGYKNGAYGGAGTEEVQNQNAAMPAAVARQIFDSDFMQQSTAYAPGGEKEMVKAGKAKPIGKRETVIRKGNGRQWEDPTLLEWDPKWYRLFVGDVSNDVNEKTLDEAFSKYPSYCKSKVVRDRLSLKAKYGFIAFKDPEDFLKAWKENDGKYIGNRPIRLSKVNDAQFGGVKTVEVGHKKAKYLDKLRRNHGKPLNGRPAPW